MSYARLWAFFALFLTATSAIAQTQTVTAPPAVRDPQAIALSTRALAALTGGRAIGDVTLVGSATRTAGSDLETGPITLKAMGNQYSQLQLSSGSGVRAETRNLGPKGEPKGIWVGLDGVAHSMPDHNTFTDSAWFFPAFSILSRVSRKYISASYVGPEDRNGASVQHLHLAVQYQNQPATVSNFYAKLSGTDVYLDATSSLPVSIVFNTHADQNSLIDIPVEIQFSDYQLVDGAAVPFHIRQLLNGVVLYDVTVQSAQLNSGLLPTDFAVQN